MTRGVKIDDAVVRRIADLAHLNLSDDEVVFYGQQLQKILTYVEQLDDVIVDELAEDDVSLPERADEVKASIPAEIAVSQAKVVQGTSFRVPRIIE